jgi:subtilisin family serine protease
MLAESAPLVQAPDIWALGGRGAGQAVAILDTGVDAAHPFLAGRVVAEACFSSRSTAIGAQSVCPNGETRQIGAGSGRPCNVEGCEHGTHVAGIAAGRSERFSGVAPDAEIIAVQVFSQFVDRARGPTPCRDSGQASPCIASFTSDQIRGLDHVLSLTAERRIAAANMSLGGGRSPGACDDDLTKPMIDQLRAAGAVTVIASGNDGFTDAVSMPGCISTAVTVGATSKQDQLASFSNRGPLVDLLGPGVAINSSIPGGQFSAFSGTSMAAPHVAGAFAALRSLRPDISIDGIERALKTTGVAVQGRPRIALLAAVQSFPPPPPNAETAMTPSLSPALERAIAQFESLPADRPVRMLARARIAEGASAQVRAEALSVARSAARAAGITHIESIEGQAMLVLEATPQQAIALAQSGAVSELQVDATARPQ